jgi:(S)-2-hydroxyglutarate dehydrogenase
MTHTAGRSAPVASDVDVAVIGGGIIGLATAHRLLEEQPGRRVVVLEREAEVGRHQSSRNSGVLHAGLYYTPGSAKARWSRAGKPLMERFCAEHGVPVERTGKVVVAVDPAELPGLERLAQRARANGVEIHHLDADGLREHEPHVSGIAGLWTPETAVTDFGAVCRALAAAIRDAGGEVRTDTEVVDIEQRGEVVHLAISSRVQQADHVHDSADHIQEQADHVHDEADHVHDRADTDQDRADPGSHPGELTARVVIACAGLRADRVAAMTGHRPAARIVPFRGAWLRLRPDRRYLVRGNIYPVPTGGGLPFLGVHLTRRIDGEVWVGPNAVLALAREGRTPWSPSLPDLADTLRFRGTWQLARRHLGVGIGEVWRDQVIAAMVREVRRYVPEIRREDVRRGPWGVRAQLVAADGSLVEDFTIDAGGPESRVLHVLNAPSPAATSALAIGSELSARAVRRLPGGAPSLRGAHQRAEPTSNVRERRHRPEPTAPHLEQERGDARMSGVDDDLPEVGDHRQREQDPQAVDEGTRGSREHQQAADHGTEQDVEQADQQGAHPDT